MLGVYLYHGVSFGNLQIIPKVIWAIFGTVLFYNLSKIGFKYHILSSVFVKWGGDSLGIYIIHTIINRYFVQGDVGLVINTGILFLDYLLCIVYSAVLTWVCVYFVYLIRKNKLAKKYLLGEK